MHRFLATSKFIDVLSTLAEDTLVITPNPASAKRLGVPHRSLRSVAEKILARENIAVASPLRSLRILRSVIREVYPDRDASVEATRIKPILSTVLRDGIDTAKLASSGIRSAETLARIAAAYCTQLDQEGSIDPEGVVWKARDLIKERKKILVYGYFRAREPDVRFIEALAGDGSIFVVPCGEESIFSSVGRSIGMLEASGWERRGFGTASSSSLTAAADKFAGSSIEQPLSADTIRAMSFASVESEVRNALGSAKQMIAAGTPADQIALVSRRADDYEKTIAAIADEYGLRIASSSKISLLQTSVGGFIDSVFDAITSGFEFAAVSRLLNHKYGVGMSTDEWKAARRLRPNNAEAWTAAGFDLSAFTVDGERRINEWVSWLLDVLPQSRIRERSGRDPVELLAYEGLRAALRELTTLEDDASGDIRFFQEEIKDILRNCSTPADPGRGGISFHQPTTIIGGTYEHVFVLGMAEGVFPAITNEDAVIDFFEQQELERKGILFDRPEEFPRWEALSFYYVLLAAKRSVSLSYSRAVDIEEKIASPFLEKLSLDVSQERLRGISSRREELRYILRGDEVRDSPQLLAAARHQLAVERRRESRLPYDEFDGSVGTSIDPASIKWSASQFTKIGQCPFKWFAEKILRLSPCEEADTDLRGSVMGRLYHRTLQIAVNRALGKEPFRDAVLTALEPAFLEAEADDEIGVRGLPNWEHRRSEHLTMLRKAIESPEFIGEGSRVLAAEKKFDIEWNGLRIGGSIDRVDQTPEGIVAVDYKTGMYVGRVKDEANELKTDIQLPVYTEVGLSSLFPGESIALGRYYSMRQQKSIKERPADIAAFAEMVKQRLRDGAFAVDPDVGRNSCKFCEYDQVCRQGLRNSRKPRD
jgi:hypothetical protein